MRMTNRLATIPDLGQFHVLPRRCNRDAKCSTTHFPVVFDSIGDYGILCGSDASPWLLSRNG